MTIFSFIDKKYHIYWQKCAKFVIGLTVGIRGEKAGDGKGDGDIQKRWHNDPDCDSSRSKSYFGRVLHTSMAFHPPLACFLIQTLGLLQPNHPASTSNSASWITFFRWMRPTVVLLWFINAQGAGFSRKAPETWKSIGQIDYAKSQYYLYPL